MGICAGPFHPGNYGAFSTGSISGDIPDDYQIALIDELGHTYIILTQMIYVGMKYL
jgi:hypothetical protein